MFVRGYFYGEGGAEAAAREEPAWREWLARTLPGADASAEHVVKTG